MTNLELQAARQLLFLSVKEASFYIAGHSTPRAWQRYENGTRAIPSEVAGGMYKALEKYIGIIEGLRSNNSALSNYSVNEFDCDNKDLDYRINQAAAAFLFAQNCSVNKV